MKGLTQTNIALAGVVLLVGYALLALNIISLVGKKRAKRQ